MAVDFTGGGMPMPKVAVPEPDGFEEYSGPMVDIGSLKHVARRGRKVWVAAALVGLVLGAAFHLFVPAKYSATADLYMVEPAGADPTAAIDNDVSLLGTRSVAEEAVKDLHLGVSPATFLASYQGTAVSNVILSVKLSAASPAQAVAYDNAVAQAFLHVRSTELALQTQLVVNGLVAQVNSLNGQIKSLTGAISSLSAAKAAPQSANQVAALVDQRTNDASQITQLQAQQQQDFLTERTAAQGTHVLDPAVALKTSDTKVIAEDALTGLVGGLLLGLGIVVVAGVISDRPRLRAEVAAALGVPVELSVGPYRPPLLLARARLRRSVRRPGTTLQVMAQRAYNHLEAAPRSTLAVLTIGKPEPAALCVSTLALSLASEGRRVVLVDMAEGRPLWRIVRGRGEPGMQSIIINDQGLTLVVAPADPTETQIVADDADFVIVLASVSPALGVEHVSAWASHALVFVTAGATGTLMTSSTELARQAGLNLRSAILVGASPDDESTGTVSGQTPPFAPRVAPAPSGPDERLARADERPAPRAAILR
jgi:capsular polysaccharide biosynthesis protein